MISKKRYVTKKLNQQMILPSEGELVAKVIVSKGNNLHEVEDCNGDTYLVSMPTKFRNAVWVRRDHFVLLQPIKEGDRVRAEISQVLYLKDILYMKERGLWPKHFEDDVIAMTREFKRGFSGQKQNTYVDEDMLPSEEESTEEDEEQESETDL